MGSVQFCGLWTLNPQRSPPSVGGLAYSWQGVLSSGAASAPLALSATVNQAATPNLFLPGRTVPAGASSASVALTVAFAGTADRRGAASASATFVVASSPLSVALSGAANAVVGALSEACAIASLAGEGRRVWFSLSPSHAFSPATASILASYSAGSGPALVRCDLTDPDGEAAAPVRYEWTCTGPDPTDPTGCLTDSGTPLAFAPNAPAQALRLLGSRAGVRYQVACTATKGARSASAGGFLLVRSVPLPTVSVAGLPAGEAVNPSARLVLLANVTAALPALAGSLRLRWGWALAAEPSVDLTDPSVREGNHFVFLVPPTVHCVVRLCA